MLFVFRALNFYCIQVETIKAKGAISPDPHVVVRELLLTHIDPLSESYYRVHSWTPHSMLIPLMIVKAL